MVAETRWWVVTVRPLRSNHDLSDDTLRWTFGEPGQSFTLGYFLRRTDALAVIELLERQLMQHNLQDRVVLAITSRSHNRQEIIQLLDQELNCQERECNCGLQCATTTFDATQADCFYPQTVLNWDDRLMPPVPVAEFLSN